MAATPAFEPGERSGGGASLKLAVDGFQHALEILIDLVVPKSQDLKTFGRKTAISQPVAREMKILIMLSTIKLDDEPVT